MLDADAHNKANGYTYIAPNPVAHWNTHFTAQPCK
jgi:hypothetical protein